MIQILKKLRKKLKKKKNYDNFRKEIRKLIENKKLVDIDSIFQKYASKGYSEVVLNKVLFSSLKDIDTPLAIAYGEKVILKEEDPKFMRVLATRYKWVGRYKEYTELIKKIDKVTRKNILTETLEEIENTYKYGKISEVEEFVANKIKETPWIKNSIYKKLFSMMKDENTAKALEFAEKIITPQSDKKFIEVVVNRYLKIGNLERVKELTDGFRQVKVSPSWFKSELISLIEDDESKEDEIKEFLESCKDLFDKNDFNKTIFSSLKDKYPLIAIEYGLKYFNTNPDDFKFNKVLALRLLRNKMPKEAFEIYKYLYEHDESNSEEYENKLLESVANVYKNDIIESIQNKLDIVEIIKNKLPKKLQKTTVIYKLLYLLLKSENGFEKEAVLYAQKYLDEEKDGFIALSLSNFLFSQGYINAALEVKHLDLEDEKTALKIKHYSAYKKLLENGFSLPSKASSNNIDKISIGYCLHNTLPYNSGGYATRSHGLAKGVQASGLDIQVISRLGYPNDLSSFSSSENLPNKDEIEGLTYYRLFTDINQYGVAPLDEYLKEYGEALYNKAKELDLTILHGASNFMNGIAANYAARKLGIKSIYEVRGLWEITRMSRQPEWEGSEHFEMIKRLETQAAKNADAVFTITQALKDEMVSRGVDKDKITILPNGVHVDRFEPLQKNKDLEKQLNVEKKTIIGFIGSFAQYEGLEYIVDAIEILVKKGKKNIVALMVGDGAVSAEVQKRVEDKNLDNYFIFTGRIPHEEVEDYYSLVDIAPLPRKGLPVCEMVSPLKPFEAMAMGKVVLSSNVAALAEIVQDGYNGMLFEKDNVEDFAHKMEILIDDAPLREKLGKQARVWVEKERDWKMLSLRLVNVYKGLLDG